MDKKNKIIIGLLAFGVILFCAIQFWIIPANQAKQAEYAKKQADALTHDITAIEEFKSPYIGNAPNVSALFENLPLCNISKRYEIDSENCTLTVNYLDTVWNIGKEKVQRDLIYNSVAAMASIDNLTGITYNFSGDTYSFTRKQIENVFGAPLASRLHQETWETEVQDKLYDMNFVGQFF